MSTRTVEQLDSWSTVPFSGGYSGLHDLADSEFSGVVIAGPARLFMLKGKVVGVLDGSIEDFEDAGGTAREAPHPGLPLLAVMQERSDEVRAKYYTEDTPLAEVDQTLSSGGFTGYVELSENVLSGDYYQIYHQGRSMSVAWVGNSDQLVTEDEAFEQADGEVGIYEVRPVDIDIVDIPEPPEPVADEEASEDAAVAETDDPEAQSSEERLGADSSTERDGADETPPSETDTEPASTDTETETAEARPPSDDASRRVESDPDAQASDTKTDTQTGSESATTDHEHATPDRSGSSAPAGEETTRAESAPPTERSGSDARSPTERERSVEETRTQSSSTASTPRQREGDRRQSERRPSADTERIDERQQAGSAQPTEDADVGPAPHDPSAGGPADLETRSIPSLDPSHSETASKATAAATADTEQTEAARHSSAQQPSGAGEPSPREPRTDTNRQDSRQATRAPQQDDSRQTDQPAERSGAEHPGAPPADRATGQEPQSPTTERQSTTQNSSQQPQTPDQSDRIDELESALEESEAERETLESELESLQSERDDLERDLEEARTEIERLEEQLAEATASETPDAETRLSQGEAIDQTNLFVRYNSKGDATLEAVHSGNAKQSAVDDNLKLEYHTQFDAATAAVGSQQFETFLTESIQYRFVDWLVRALLYEIRDTGNPDTMSELFDALPKIDRAELNGQVSVEYVEDGEQHRTQEQFDVVVRDRMGNPLIVANINDSRDPATDSMMTDLIRRAERVGSSSDSLAGAFLVTESFFEPPALETAEEATSSGLLSRDKRKSFVNLSRKDGYHLCLVEARNQEFHLAVPEL